MSYEVANENKMLGQFASNQGLSDLVAAADSYPALKDFLNHGGSERVAAVLKDIDALLKTEKDADVKSTATDLRDLIKDQDLIVITNGVMEDDDAVSKAGSGVMLAFWPEEEIATLLAAEDGEDPNDLHVTLAYFGKDLDEAAIGALKQAVERFASTHAPVSGTLGGLGRFPATPQSDGLDTAYLGFHSAGIQRFRRELVEHCNAYGVQQKQDFGYNPHMTLKQVAPHAPHLLPTPDPVQVKFDEIVLSVAGEKTAYPLTGKEPEDPIEVGKGDQSFELEGEIVCKDESKHLVFGIFSVVSINGQLIEDTQGDVIAESTLEDSAYSFVLDSRKGGEMHCDGQDGEVRCVGRLVESVIFTEEKQQAMRKALHDQGIDADLNVKAVFWWGGFKVDDPDTWNDITAGKLRAFSIGGRGSRKKIE